MITNLTNSVAGVLNSNDYREVRANGLIRVYQDIAISRPSAESVTLSVTGPLSPVVEIRDSLGKVVAISNSQGQVEFEIGIDRNRQFFARVYQDLLEGESSPFLLTVTDVGNPSFPGTYDPLSVLSDQPFDTIQLIGYGNSEVLIARDWESRASKNHRFFSVNGSSFLAGGLGNDTLSGGATYKATNNQLDQLVGFEGSDNFYIDAEIYGQQSGSGFALVWDFNPTQGDQLTLEAIAGLGGSMPYEFYLNYEEIPWAIPPIEWPVQRTGLDTIISAFNTVTGTTEMIAIVANHVVTSNEITPLPYGFWSGGMM